MSHRGLATVWASIGIDRRQSVMRAALIALGARGTALGCLHIDNFRMDLRLVGASGFQGSQHSKPGIEIGGPAIASCLIKVCAA